MSIHGPRLTRNRCHRTRAELVPRKYLVPSAAGRCQTPRVIRPIGLIGPIRPIPLRRPETTR
jgi:hypothetical protein